MGIITTEAKFAPTPTTSSGVQPGSSNKTSATSSATAVATSAKKASNGAVIGGAVGGVVGAVLIIGALVVFCKGRGKKEEVIKVDGNSASEN